MRFMVMVKATKDSEAGVMPTEELLTAMMKYNEELVKAGIMLAGDGLHPSSKGARVRFSGDKRSVVDGPFAETKELVAGYWIWQVQVARRGDRMGKALPQPDAGRRPRSKFARSSRWKTSPRSPRRRSATSKSACASNPKSSPASRNADESAIRFRAVRPGACWSKRSSAGRLRRARRYWRTAAPASCRRSSGRGLTTSTAC